jgi:hypothetical protein
MATVNLRQSASSSVTLASLNLSMYFDTFVEKYVPRYAECIYQTSGTTDEWQRMIVI